MTINNSKTENVTWSGTVRPAIHDLAVVPRPVNGSCPSGWQPAATPRPRPAPGSSACPSPTASSAEPRTGSPRWPSSTGAAAAQAGHTGGSIKVSVAALGLIAPTKKEALDGSTRAGTTSTSKWAGSAAGPHRTSAHSWHRPTFPGAYYVGDPDEVAERIVDLHGHMGHMRHFLQMDIGGLPQEHLLESITLLATEVKPRVERLLSLK